MVGAGGKRRVPVEKVVTGPGSLSLRSDEFVEAIVLPERKGNSGDAYLRFTPRTEMDIAVVSAGVNLTLSRGVVKTARVALGAVAPTAVLVSAAARSLVGTKLTMLRWKRWQKPVAKRVTQLMISEALAAYRTQVAGYRKSEQLYWPLEEQEESNEWSNGNNNSCTGDPVYWPHVLRTRVCLIKCATPVKYDRFKKKAVEQEICGAMVSPWTVGFVCSWGSCAGG